MKKILVIATTLLGLVTHAQQQDDADFNHIAAGSIIRALQDFNIPPNTETVKLKNSSLEGIDCAFSFEKSSLDRVVRAGQSLPIKGINGRSGQYYLNHNVDGSDTHTHVYFLKLSEFESGRTIHCSLKETTAANESSRQMKIGDFKQILAENGLELILAAPVEF